MKQITLQYDGKNSMAQKTINYILSLGIFKQVEPKGIDIAIDEVKKGKTKTYKNVDEFFEKLN
jgi:hypothetical protein